ncbi:MAG: helix-turn-helix transcriptional regulator [Pseudoxanthomonas sp.]
MSAFTSLPEAGFLRVAQIVNIPAKGDKPAHPGLIPVSKATWFAGVRSGRYPKPTHALGPNISAWSIADIRKFIEAAAGQAHGGEA